MELETVKIVTSVSADNPLGHITINKSDFNEKIHELFEEIEDKVLNIEKAGVTELKALLSKLGVEFPGNAKVAELRELATTAQAAASDAPAAE